MKKYLIILPIITVLITCKLNTSNSENSPPTINEITVNPSQPISGQVVTLNAIATDSDGDDLTYNWSVSAGQLSSDGIGNPVQWTTPLTGGEINIICVVSDSKDVGTKNIVINITFEYGILKGYVFDNFTNLPLGATLYIENHVENSNAIGYYEFDELELGDNILSVIGHGYNHVPFKDTLYIYGGENNLDIYLQRQFVNYSGIVYQESTNNTIEGALVSIGEYEDITSYRTSSSGQWSIGNLEIGKTFDFIVSAGGYEIYSNSLTIIKTDTSFVTYLKPE